MSDQQTMQFEWEEVTNTALMRAALIELAKLENYEENPNEALYAYPLGKAVEYYTEQFIKNLNNTSGTAIPSSKDIKQINSTKSSSFYRHYNEEPPAPVDGPPKYEDPSSIIQNHIRPMILETLRLLPTGPTSGWGRSSKEISVIAKDPNTGEEHVIAPSSALEEKFELKGGKARLPQLEIA